ncbi:MAG: hypothetical protein AAGK32_22595, partial [Actinomycetota bacterium]
MAYATEVDLAIGHVADTWTGSSPPRVAALVIDNEFGHGVLEATEAALGSVLPGAELVIMHHDPASPILDTEVVSLLESDPDVFLALTAGNPCLLAIQEVGAALDQPDLRFLLSPCHDPNAFLIPAGPAADAGVAEVGFDPMADRVGALGQFVEVSRTSLETEPAIGCRSRWDQER